MVCYRGVLGFISNKKPKINIGHTSYNRWNHRHKNRLNQAIIVPLMKDSFNKEKIPVNVLNFENYFVECVAKKP